MTHLGFNDGWVQIGAWRPTTPADYRYLGASWARVTWDWTKADRNLVWVIIDRFHLHGIKTVLCPYSYENDVDVVDDYIEQLLPTVERYPGYPIEPWNEVNWTTYGNWPVGDYAHAFRKVHRAVKAVNRRQRLLACSGYMVPCGVEDWQKRFSELTVDLTYGASLHCYLGGCLNMKGDPVKVANQVLDRCEATFPNRAIWATEVGWNGTEAEQEFMLGEMYKTLAARLERVFIHRLYDSPGGDGNWGICRADGSWKPVTSEVKEKQ